MNTALSNALLKAGVIDQNRIEEVKLNDAVDKIIKRLMKEVDYHVCKRKKENFADFVQIEKMYVGENTRNFIIHLIRAYISPKIKVDFARSIPKQGITCPICGVGLATLEALKALAPKLCLQYIENHKDGYSTTALTEHVLSKLDKKAAKCSEASSKLICSPCAHSLTVWFSHVHKVGKDDKMLRRLFYELFRKKDEDA